MSTNRWLVVGEKRVVLGAVATAAALSAATVRSVPTVKGAALTAWSGPPVLARSRWLTTRAKAASPTAVEAATVMSHPEWACATAVGAAPARAPGRSSIAAAGDQGRPPGSSISAGGTQQ